MHRDGKAEARPPELARRRVVCLRERLEHSRFGTLVQPDAGVAHLEAQSDLPAIVRQHLDGHLDVPTQGELDGIAHQIEQDLPQPARVAHQTRRQFRIHAGDDLKALVFGQPTHQRHDRLDGARHLDVKMLDVELLRLDPRVIQHVVDERQQRPARLVDGLGELRLLWRQVGVEQQFGHAQHPIHGCADLMADGGQELRLGLIGGLAQLIGDAQVMVDLLQFVRRDLEAARPQVLIAVKLRVAVGHHRQEVRQLLAESGQSRVVGSRCSQRMTQGLQRLRIPEPQLSLELSRQRAVVEYGVAVHRRRISARAGE